MADSLREQILSKFFTELDALAETVKREHVDQFADDELPVRNVYPVSESVEDDGGRDEVTRRLTVAVEHVVKLNPAESLTASLDALVNATVKEILEADFSGLAVEVRETGTQWSLTQGEESIGSAATSFEVLYLTSRTDPAVSAN
jgi:hypothetical protein